MARRLTPEARRAEIIAVTQDAITGEGYHALSLREIARRCGMSAPGLMHYFADLPTLLEAVLDHRDDVDRTAIIDDPGSGTSVLDMLDVAEEYYRAHDSEAQSFDALEAEALDPNHPAYDYFRRRNEHTIERLRPLIEREFENPQMVERIVRLMFDGIRLNRIHDDGGHALAKVDGEQALNWRAVRMVLSGLPKRLASD